MSRRIAARIIVARRAAREAAAEVDVARRTAREAASRRAEREAA